MIISQNIFGHSSEKKCKTKTDDFSNVLTSSKRRHIKLESARRNEFNNSICQNFRESKNFHHYSRFIHKGPSRTGRVIRTIRNLLKKPVS